MLRATHIDRKIRLVDHDTTTKHACSSQHTQSASVLYKGSMQTRYGAEVFRPQRRAIFNKASYGASSARQHMLPDGRNSSLDQQRRCTMCVTRRAPPRCHKALEAGCQPGVVSYHMSKWCRPQNRHPLAPAIIYKYDGLFCWRDE